MSAKTQAWLVLIAGAWRLFACRNTEFTRSTPGSASTPTGIWCASLELTSLDPRAGIAAAEAQDVFTACEWCKLPRSVGDTRIPRHGNPGDFWHFL